MWSEWDHTGELVFEEVRQALSEEFRRDDNEVREGSVDLPARLGSALGRTLGGRRVKTNVERLCVQDARPRGYR